LRDYDYSQVGAYFVTICTDRRVILFGDVAERGMAPNDAGRAVEHCWLEIPNHFPNVKLDAFVVMPNHVHGIIFIVDSTVGAKNISPLHHNSLPSQQSAVPRGTIGSIVRGFKIGVTKWFRENIPNAVVWQRNYYEHVIRSEASLNRIRQYILDNPAQWAFDRENPSATVKEPENVWLA